MLARGCTQQRADNSLVALGDVYAVEVVHNREEHQRMDVDLCGTLRHARDLNYF